jgi:hypothetical protein
MAISTQIILYLEMLEFSQKNSQKKTFIKEK